MSKETGSFHQNCVEYVNFVEQRDLADLNKEVETAHTALEGCRCGQCVHWYSNALDRAESEKQRLTPPTGVKVYEKPTMLLNSGLDNYSDGPDWDERDYFGGI